MGMNVVFATDDGYAMQLGISLVSLFENNQETEGIRCYVLDGGIAEENRTKLIKIADKYKREVSFISVADYMNYLPDDYDSHGYNPIVFARLMLPNYLPGDVETVLYIDCDTIVHGSVAELERISAELLDRNLSVAAVPELYMPSDAKVRSIGFGRNETYYNAGVLLINLKNWRMRHIQDIFLNYYRKNKERLLYNDQDVINFCCRGEVLPLSPRYNISANFPYYPYYFRRIIQPAYKESRRESKDLIRHPSIIHYMGDERPWINGNRNYYQAEYEYYKKMTPWSGEPMVYGQESYMKLYHAMNVCTRIFPWGRIVISKLIGIHKYEWWGKES